ncbi:hypothetical protein Poli38472_001967 [Pythium oligandrum]|uniref:Magnesium transporter n=1 Tax=Pythium oligandrum TaxID=41045 RepID=A0A8K1FNV7_PYTOL|nr:hypothetical protein Poli38472_001967 [Pythium oligandrum]|eukprot:TMW69811.1 hypothetical protein Poli38472_001967 [Pythium oligandrum]
MGFVGWPLGLFLSAVSSVFGILGKLFLKLAHNQRELDEDEAMRRDQHAGPYTSRLWYMYFYSGLVSMLVLNPALASVAYCFASQSLLAPMAGLTIGWNTLMGPLLLPNERLTTHDFVGALLIVTGCVLVGVSGSHSTPPMPVEHLASRFATFPFITYSVALTAMLVFLLHQSRPALQLTRSNETDLSPKRRTGKNDLSQLSRVCISVLAGVSSGQLFFLSATMRLLKDGSAAHVWRYPVTYFCIFGAISTALLGLYLLNAALKVEDAVVVIYLYEASYILTGAISGLCFFADMNDLSPWHYVVYSLSLVLILLGIYVVARRNSSLTDADDENLLPLLSAPASVDDVSGHRLFKRASYYAARRSSSPTRMLSKKPMDETNRSKSFPFIAFT